MTPVLVDTQGKPLRSSMGYNGSGVGFGGQLAEWMPPSQGADEALLPGFRIGNARADDLVRNNAIATNAIALHQDHIIGNMFRLSYRPNWKFIGMREEDAQAFADDIEAAWMEYSDSARCYLDLEGKNTFTGLMREAIAVHAFAGEIFMMPVYERAAGHVFGTRFRLISPKRVENPFNGADTATRRGGVEIDRNGRAIAYNVRDGNPLFGEPTRYVRIPREIQGGRAGMIHVFRPQEPHQTRGANRFYSVMERLKMLDTLQATQLQSAIVKAMYAATIESDLDTKQAMEFIGGATQGTTTSFDRMLLQRSAYYAGMNIKLGGVKVPHLMNGDRLNLQSAQNSDNGFSALEEALLRYVAAGLGVSYEQLSRDYSKVSYSSARASANESWRHFMGQRKLVAAVLSTLMFECWLEEVIATGIINPPRSARTFWEARSSWSRSEWIGAGRMAIDGLKEVQESVMLIEVGLSTYEKELAKLGEDYQELFRQQVRESEERRKAGLSRPAWIAETFNNQLQESSRQEN